MYSGYLMLNVPSELIDQLYAEKQLALERLSPHLDTEYEQGAKSTGEIFANQFVQLRDQLNESHSGLSRRLGDTEHLIPIVGPRKPVAGIMARNVQQTMAFDILLDNEIKLVTLWVWRVQVKPC